jgi:hypothetical protein
MMNPAAEFFRHLGRGLDREFICVDEGRSGFRPMAHRRVKTSFVFVFGLDSLSVYWKASMF